MALILMEDNNQEDSAFIIGLYELQRELSYLASQSFPNFPNKTFHIDLDYLRKCTNILTYIPGDNEKLQTIQIIKHHNIVWKQIAQDCFEVLLTALREWNIEIRKPDNQLLTYKEQYTKLEKTITEMIRPALAAHAGNIQIAYFTKHIIGLKLLGSCKGCPFSLQTLTLHIAKILGMFFPEFFIIHVTHFAQWEQDMDALIE